MITALKHYGLLEPAGAGLRISADAVRMLELPEGDPERTAALVRLVFAPPIFAELRSKYGDQLPLSVRHTLVTQDFAPNAADEIIRLYRANFEFIRDRGGSQATDVGKAERQEEASAPELRESSTSRGRIYSETTAERVLQFQIPEDTDARIHSEDDRTVLPSRS